MQIVNQKIERIACSGEVGRYIINGLLATAVHYCVLIFNLKILYITSTGLANFIAAFFGISASFLGSRYFVYRKCSEDKIRQAGKFIILYACIACLHGSLLFIWSDVFKLNINIGFVFATALQVLLGYTGNKVLVFKT